MKLRKDILLQITVITSIILGTGAVMLIYCGLTWWIAWPISSALCFLILFIYLNLPGKIKQPPRNTTK